MRRILLASTGKPYSPDVLERATALASEHGAKVSILQLMRVWGSGLGLPHPGLKPNKQEQEAATATVREARCYLREQGIKISGAQVIATRKPSTVIAREATLVGADLIVIGAPEKVRRGDFRWDNEAHRVAKKTAIPVVIVITV